MDPTYDELPLLPGSDLRHAWDVFGTGDALGTLNRLTEERRREAATLVRHGLVSNLSIPVTDAVPGLFGRQVPEHVVFPTSGFSWDDRLDGLYLQGSTQWDGLLHVHHKDFGFYGGERTEGLPSEKLGIEHWVRHGIVGRGVLVDVAGWYAAQGLPYEAMTQHPVGAAEVERIAADQGVVRRPGDVLCLRFGWLEEYRKADPTARARVATDLACAGLSAAPDTARYLWDTGTAAVVCDNPTLEVQPGNRDQGYLHHRLLTMLGMPIGELFALDELAAHCARLGTKEFLFMSAPLHVPGGVGAPANALALL